MVELIVLILASFRITRMITRDTIFDSLRDRIPEGEDVSLGYMIRCDWCAGIWVSGAVVGITAQLTSIPLPVLVWFAVAGALGLLASWEK